MQKKETTISEGKKNKWPDYLLTSCNMFSNFMDEINPLKLNGNYIYHLL
jgi:hypothetical protein